MVRRILCTVLALCALFGLSVTRNAAQGIPVNSPPTGSSNATPGAELFKQHCAVCHGTDLKGNVPFLAPYRPPPDLTTLARRHGGRFPDAYVARVLRSGVTLPEHGPAEMPVWGEEFRITARGSESEVRSRIGKLTEYIKSHQKK